MTNYLKATVERIRRLIQYEQVIVTLDDYVWRTYQDEMDAGEDHIELAGKLDKLSMGHLVPKDIRQMMNAEKAKREKRL